MSRNPDERRLIFRGANSEVWEVLAEGSKRIKKITTLPMNLDDESEMDREALSRMVFDHNPLCSLKHRNLVQLFGITANLKEYTFTVDMERIEGKSLEKRINDVAGGLSEKYIRLYSTQICDALAYLHENDVLHRNISGKTVMITNDNVVKLIDFGISIQLLHDASGRSSDMAHGEPQFMAPELCVLDESQGGFMHSRGSDIWAFGCLVFYMVTGRKPLAECRNMMAIVRRICDEAPPGLPDTCSDALMDFHRGCVVKKRRERVSAVELRMHPFLSPPCK